MKTKIKRVAIVACVLAAILVIAVACMNLQNLQQLALTSSARLWVDGRYIRDQTGKAIDLRGYNAGGFGDTCSGWFMSTWNENTVRSQLQQMSSYGATYMRIMLNIRWWLENSQETYDSTSEKAGSNRPYRQNVLDTISIAAEYNIYVSVSFWSIDTNYAWGSRSPSTQDYNPYPPYASTQNFPTIRNSADFVELWAGTTSSEFLNRFKTAGSATSPYVHNNGQPPPSMSDALRNYNNVIYELYNEPQNYGSWIGVTQQCVDAIRARGDNTPIMVMCGYCGSFYGYAGSPYNQAWGLAMKTAMTGRTNIIFSNHIYQSDGSLPNVQPNYNSVYASLFQGTADPAYAINMVSNQYPVIIGEMGSGSLAEYVFQALNNEHVGWAAWEWRNGLSGSFGTLVQQYLTGTSPTPPPASPTPSASPTPTPQPTPTPTPTPTPPGSTPTPTPTPTPDGGGPPPTPNPNEGTLSGTVTSSINHLPIAGAYVKATKAGDSFAITTGSNGEYAINLPSGTYEVTISKNNATALFSDVQLTSNQYTMLNAELDLEEPRISNEVIAAVVVVVIAFIAIALATKKGKGKRKKGRR